MRQKRIKSSVKLLQTLANYRHQLRLFLKFSESAAAQYGLEPQHHQLLLQVAGVPDGTQATVGYAAARLGLRANSVGQLCKRMEEKGLIIRTSAEGDRRLVVLTPTAKGRDVLEALSIDHASELSDLSPQLIRTLSRITASYSAAISVSTGMAL